MSNAHSVRRRFPAWASALAALATTLALSAQEEAPLKEPDLAIGLDVTQIRTGHLETNARGQAEALAVPVLVTIQNRSGSAVTTSAEITGKNRDAASVELEKTEDSEIGQTLHLRVLGLRPTFDDSEVFLTVSLKRGDEVKATRSLPIRVSVPTLLKLEGDVVFDGPAVPGLVNRALNMRTTPKAAVSHPEARLASMCLHDVSFTVLDQFGDPLPPIFKGAPVFAALGQSDYEMTNRLIREDGSFIDSIGFWQFVGGIDDITVDPGRAEVQKFLSTPPPPCTAQQYTTYEPLLVQYQVGGYPIGSYQRQVTLKDSGDDHKPIMRIVFNPVEEAAGGGPGPK
jgi:hypothetical protein